MKSYLPPCFLLSLALSFFLSPLVAQTPTAPVVAPDYGDYRSETLTSKAWDALGRQQYSLVYAYTGKCVEMYSEEARKMQAGLTALAPAETASGYWALNDVGTCLFIRAQALEAEGKTSEALAAYNTIVDSFSFAQTWDPKGWYWAPAGAAKQRIQVLNFDAL